jgi:hypothetical protein
MRTSKRLLMGVGRKSTMRRKWLKGFGERQGRAAKLVAFVSDESLLSAVKVISCGGKVGGREGPSEASWYGLKKL